MRLYQHEENDKKKKGIALKALSSSIHEKNDKKDSNEKNLEEDQLWFQSLYKEIQ